MRFRLVSLFALTTALAVFCGVVFAAPLAVTAIVLAVTMWVSPAVWISGASYAQGGRQAFFRGGLVCGLVPFGVATWYMATILIEVADEITALPSASADFDMQVRATFAVAWLLPGVFAFFGGSLSYVTYLLVQPRASSAPAATPRWPSGEYQVVDGRLTTQPPSAVETGRSV